MRKRFLYYLPGLPGCNEQMLARRGLRSRFVALGGNGLTEHVITAVDQGPDNGSGCIIGIGSQPAEFNPLGQTWEKFEHYWLGVDNELAPTPEDLVREFGFTGYELRLVDDGVWRIPLIRKWNSMYCKHSSMLPRCLRPVPGKGVQEVVNPKYQAYDDIAERIWQSFLKEEQVSVEKLFTECSAILSINYRIDKEEVGLLGLLTQENALELLSMVIDVPGIKEHSITIASNGVEVSLPTIEEEHP